MRRLNNRSYIYLNYLSNIKKTKLLHIFLLKQFAKMNDEAYIFFNENDDEFDNQ